jgi:PAS domain S-box-containing protein
MAGFGLAMAVLLVVGIFQYRTVGMLIQGEGLVARTYDVIAELEGSYSGLQQAESGTRGYVATGVQDYVDLLDQGVERADRHLLASRTLIADSSQQQKLNRLVELAAQKRKVMENLVALRREQGFAAASEELSRGEGLRLMREIRALTDDMEEDQNGLLELRQAAIRAEARSAWLAILLGTILALSLTLVAGWIAHRDANKRRQSEELVRRASLHSRSLIEASLDPLVTISAEGKITDVNEATVKVTGVPRDKLIGTDFANYFTEPENAREGYQRVFSEGFVTDYPLTVRHAEGQLTDVLYNASIYRDTDGKVLGVFAAARDITKRKQQVEEALRRRAEELARSNAELQQFAYVASHDLQEPLRMVASFAQLLAERYRGKLDADADEFIGYAVDGARRMQVLVNDLLEYSHVGKRAREFAAVDCEKILKTVLENLQKTLEETGGQVTHDPLPPVQGDHTQLGQVFQNLVANALKFHGSEPPRVHISAEQIKGEWRFSVRDNGIGIDLKHAERIFLLFQRLHTRAEYSGTGMGLAITKKIVERHGGRIWLESEPGKGSTFYFSLPMKGVTHGNELRASATG